MNKSSARAHVGHRPAVAAAMAIARKAAGIYPPLFNSVWRMVYPRTRYNHAVASVPGNRRETFDTIYRNNVWGSAESVSGLGSTLANTLPVRRALPGLLRSLGVRTMLDAPCGDFNWMRHVDLSGVHYIGGDIVPELLRATQAVHGGADRAFRPLDILQDPLPPADLWLCRDVLIHFSNEDALALLHRAARAPIRYLLTTHYELCPRNMEINTGGYRPINLCIAPFNLPRPLRRIDDFLAPWQPRSLGLWSREQLRLALGILDDEAEAAPAG